ncbi:SET and MYND domain-containing protein 3, partial [Nephila pilipes]
LSRFESSCIPNCGVLCDGPSLFVRCMKKTRKNEEQLTIAPCLLVKNFEAHLDCMNSTSLKNCKPCKHCQVPYGTSLLTKILDQKKACSVISESQDTLQLAHYLHKFNYPLDIITQHQLRQLLQKQKGVLGNTNILRIRILFFKCCCLDGPILEMKRELEELVVLIK